MCFRQYVDCVLGDACHCFTWIRWAQIHESNRLDWPLVILALFVLRAPTTLSCRMSVLCMLTCLRKVVIISSSVRYREKTRVARRPLMVIFAFKYPLLPLGPSLHFHPVYFALLHNDSNGTSAHPYTTVTAKNRSSPDL